MTEPYRVFALIDDRDCILSINSDAFLADTAGWVQIDEGSGDRYHHAQGNYLQGPVFDERGIPRYKLVDGEVVERTQEEMDAEVAVMPPAPATVDERLDELYAALDMILTGVTE